PPRTRHGHQGIRPPLQGDQPQPRGVIVDHVSQPRSSPEVALQERPGRSHRQPSRAVARQARPGRPLGFALRARQAVEAHQNPGGLEELLRGRFAAGSAAPRRKPSLLQRRGLAVFLQPSRRAASGAAPRFKPSRDTQRRRRVAEPCILRRLRFVVHLCGAARHQAEDAVVRRYTAHLQRCGAPIEPRTDSAQVQAPSLANTDKHLYPSRNGA
ncbi:hypothetical protein T484DRAFT_1914155, partial [Baffinella frigidus]